VFMVLGQVAATAAIEAIDTKLAVQQISVTSVQKELRENPLADGSLPEIVVDNNDSSSVVITGNWETRRGGFGRDYLFSKGKSADLRTVKYVPSFTEGGIHEVFIYLSKNKERAHRVVYTVFDGVKTNEIIIDNSSIKELGLSSGEWVSLGRYKFLTGKESFIEVSNKDADGLVTADAVILKRLK